MGKVATLDARHKPGANNPPVESPFEKAAKRIEDLYLESGNWIDGKPIETQAQADEVQTLLRMLQEAETEADQARVAENKPFDDGKAEVQARYAPLIGNTQKVKGKTVLAIMGCKAAVQNWLLKVQAEQRVEAERLRKEAQAQAAEAQAALDAARETPDLAAFEQAEQAIQDASVMARAADRAEKAKPKAAGYGRAVGLRTVYTPALADPVKALGWCWLNERAAMEEAILAIAKTRTHGGVCTMPGIALKEEQVV